MPALLPLFPLGTVLFPGLVLPLHVFEERYRALVRDLAAMLLRCARWHGCARVTLALVEPAALAPALRAALAPSAISAG